MRKVRIAIVWAVLATVGGRAADPVFDPEQVSALWKAREEKVKTARFEWTETTFYPKGGFSREHYSPLAGPLKGEAPAADAQVTVNSRFCLDGVKVRYDHQSIQWDDEKKALAPLAEQAAYDGKHIYQTRGNPGEVDYGGGVTGLYDGYRDAGRVAIRPVFGAFRCRTRRLQFVNPHDCHPTGRRAAIDGLQCVECLVRKYKTGGGLHVWLAPDRDWLIARQISDGHETRRKTLFDIRYRPDSTAGWTPASWEYTVMLEGVLTSTYRIEVTKYELNVPIDPSEFVLAFPPGMRVYHEDRSMVGLQPGGYVQPDGRVKPDGGGQGSRTMNP